MADAALKGGIVEIAATFVTANLTALANALVDVPLAYAQGQAPGSHTVPVTLITKGSAEVEALRREFAATS
jgi:hypothetical protein